MSDEPPTIAPEAEPEYVGAHSALVDSRCQDWIVEGGPDGMEHRRCVCDATHTVVMADGNGLHEIAMCNDCGEPNDVGRVEREWTGELRDGSEGER